MHPKEELYTIIKPLFQQLDSEILPTLTRYPSSQKLHQGIPVLDKVLSLLSQEGYLDHWKYGGLYHSFSSLKQFFLCISSIQPNEFKKNKYFLKESKTILRMRMKNIEDILKEEKKRRLKVLSS